MNLGPGALAQSGSSQGLHSQGGLSDAVGSGLPPPSLLQGQIGNGEPGAHGRASGFGLLPRTVACLAPWCPAATAGCPSPPGPQWPGRVCGCTEWGRRAEKKALRSGWGHLGSGLGAP